MRKITLLALVLTTGCISCQQKEQPKTLVERVTESHIMSKKLSLNSELWEKLKTGKHEGGLGRDGLQWKSYITNIEAYHNEVLGRLKPDVRKEMEKYPFCIGGMGGGGSWQKMTKIDSGIVEWDDIPDFDKVKFDGVSVHYSENELNEGIRSTIVHEYFHGIWDVFGVFAGKETRMIDRDMFRADTERLVHDPDYAKTPLMEEIYEGWSLDATEEEIQRTKKEYPEDIGPNGTIIQKLTERFAHLAQVYFKNPETLPEYIQRHFRPFFKL